MWVVAGSARVGSVGVALAFVICFDRCMGLGMQLLSFELSCVFVFIFINCVCFAAVFE